MTKILKILMIFLGMYFTVLSSCIAATPDIAVVLVLDQSSALSEDEFTLEKQAFVEALNTLPSASNGRVRIASVVNSASPNIISHLSPIDSKADLNQFQTVLLDIHRNISGNNINAALSTAMNLLVNSSSHRKVICLANHALTDNPASLYTLASQAKNAEIIIVPIGLNANPQSAAQLERITSQPPISNIQNFSELQTAIETDCIAKVQYMLMTAVLTPLKNGIEPFSRTFTLGTQVDGNTVTDTGRYSVTTFDATSALGGTVVDNGNLTFSYTLPTLFLQQDSFNYTVNDNTTGTDSTSMWMISPLVANADTATVKSGTTITLSVLDNDANFSGDAIVINTFDATSTQGGTITNNGNNGLVYTSASGFIGTDTFNYSAATSAGFSPSNGSATATITVTAPNTAPIANNDSANTSQNTAVTTPNVLSNDTDADGDTLSISSADATSTQGGTITNNNDGTFLYTPPTGFTGSDSFNYIVSDGQDTATASVTIMVSIGNTAPTANNDTANTSQDTAVTIPNVLSNDTDADGDTLSITSADATSTQGGIITNNNDGTFLYTPPTGFIGSDSFNYIVNDGQDTATASVTITVSIGNTAPTANNDTVNTIQDTAVTTPNVLSNDTDADGDTLSISSADATSTQGGIITNNNDGTFLYTPPTGFTGSDSFNYIINDGQDTATASVTITVSIGNTAPIANNDSANTSQDTAVTTPNVLSNDTDADGDTLSISSADATSTQGGTVSNNNDGTFLYTPPTGFTGSDSFNYIINDGQDTATASVTITVSIGNTAPIANNDTASLSQNTSINIAVLNNDSDADNDALSIKTVDTHSAQNGTIIRNSDNTLSYTPALNFVGLDTFAYSIEDTQGETDTATVTITINPPIEIEQGSTNSINVLSANEANAAVSLPQTESTQGGMLSIDASTNLIRYIPRTGFSGIDTFSYTVTDQNGNTRQGTISIVVNAAPTANNDTATTNQDMAIRLTILANDTDIENDSFVISQLDNSSIQKGSIVKNNDNSVTYTPALGFVGTDSFSYSIQDSKGGIDSATVSIKVNSLPTANEDSSEINQGETVRINVLANDSDLESSTLSVSLSTTESSQGGTIRVEEENNIILYTPAVGFSGVDTFSYTVTDDSGGSSQGTVSIAVNAPPIAIDDTASANKDIALEINVLSNDSDADIDDILHISLNTQQSNKGGRIRVQDSAKGIIVYTPPLGFYSDNDTFEYTVTDSKGSSDTAIVTVVVVSLVANNDAISTTEGTTVIISNVMDNDIDSTNSISIVSFNAPRKGQLIHNGAGNFSYTPKADFIGFDSFSYTVQTQSGTRATAIVNITINGAGGVVVSEGGGMGINSLLMLFFLYFVHLLRQYWKFNRHNPKTST